MPILTDDLEALAGVSQGSSFTIWMPARGALDFNMLELKLDAGETADWDLCLPATAGSGEASVFTLGPVGVFFFRRSVETGELP
jgi:hypothetical protein